MNRGVRLKTWNSHLLRLRHPERVLVDSERILLDVLVTLVDDEEIVGREEEEVRLLLVDQAVEFVVQLRALVEVEARADLHDELVRLRVVERDVVAGAVLADGLGVPQLVRVVGDGHAPRQTDRVELLLVDAFEQDGPFEGEDFELDAGAGEVFLQDRQTLLVGRAGIGVDHGEDERLAVLIQHAVAVGVLPARVG